MEPSIRRNRLMVGEPSGNGDGESVHLSDGLQHAERIRRIDRSMLILATERKREHPGHGARAQPGYLVESFPIRPSVIVDDGLSEVVSVAQRLARNPTERV